MSTLIPTTSSPSVPAEARDGGTRLLAVVGLVLLGTVLTVKAFLESGSVVEAASPSLAETPAPAYAPELEPYRTTSSLWGSPGAQRLEGEATGGLGLRRVLAPGLRVPATRG
jgi:hypothetical protein